MDELSRRTHTKGLTEANRDSKRLTGAHLGLNGLKNVH